MFFLWLLAAATPSLHLELQRDPGLPCAAHAALEQRLLALDPQALSQEDAGERLEVRLAWERAAWQLELARPDGTRALARSLRFGPADCALVAESAALIIDRYLAAIREPPGEAQVALAPAEPPRRQHAAAVSTRAPNQAGATAPAQRAPGTAASAPPIPAPAPTSPATRRSADQAVSRPVASRASPASASGNPAPQGAPASARAPAELAQAAARAPSSAAASTAAPARAPMAPSPAASAPGDEGRAGASGPAPELRRAPLAVALGPAALVGLPGDARFAGLLEVEHPLAELSTRLLFLAAASSSQSALVDGAPRGAISAQSFLFALSAGPCVSHWLRACASGVLGARLSFGSSSGQALYATSSAELVQPELGALVSLDRALGERWELRFSLLLGAVPGSGAFEVAGSSPRSLSSFDIAAALLVGYQIF